MAQALHADACRTHSVVAWVVAQGLRDYPGEFVARLVTNAPTAYVLAADTLAGLYDQLPIRLVRKKRHPDDPPQVVEVWIAK